MEIVSRNMKVCQSGTINGRKVKWKFLREIVKKIPFRSTLLEGGRKQIDPFRKEGEVKTFCRYGLHKTTVIKRES